MERGSVLTVFRLWMVALRMSDREMVFFVMPFSLIVKPFPWLWTLPPYKAPLTTSGGAISVVIEPLKQLDHDPADQEGDDGEVAFAFRRHEP